MTSFAAVKITPTKAILLVISLAGLGLWWTVFFQNRPLFLDELNVARNLYDRSFGGLFSPLDHRQYGSPLWLAAAKLCGELFGYREWALRLPGMLAATGLVVAIAYRSNHWLAALFLAFLFVNPEMLRYVGELKPYALDLVVAAGLLYAGWRGLQPSKNWLLVGLVAPWLSLPAVFSLAAVGLTALALNERKNKLRWVGIGTAWLLSFGLLFLLVIQPSLGDGPLNEYHRDYFPPFPPTNGADWRQIGGLLLGHLKTAFGYTGYAVVVGGALSLLGLIFLPTKEKMLLGLPIALGWTAAALGLYSLLPRLLLYSLPAWWALALSGAAKLRIPENWIKSAVVIILLPLFLSTNVLRFFAAPYSFGDSRKLVTQIKDNYRVVLDPTAVPAADYYQRIHPDHRVPPALRWSLVPATPPPYFDAKTVVLYDVTTARRVKDRLAGTQARAERRGQAFVNDSLLHGAQLYIDPN